MICEISQSQKKGLLSGPIYISIMVRHIKIDNIIIIARGQKLREKRWTCLGVKILSNDS